MNSLHFHKKTVSLAIVNLLILLFFAVLFTFSSMLIFLVLSILLIACPFIFFDAEWRKKYDLYLCFFYIICGFALAYFVLR